MSKEAKQTDKEDVLEPIQNALYATGKMTIDDCNEVADGIIDYLTDHGFLIVPAAPLPNERATDFFKINDLRPFLLQHPDQDMVESACLHFLGDDAQQWWRNRKSPTPQTVPEQNNESKSADWRTDHL